MTPFDFIKDISFEKKNLLEEDPHNIKFFDPWLTNKGLSYFHDTIEYANYMNLYYQLDKELQHNFLINIVRPRKRFSKWHKNEKDSDLQAVMKYYGYNANKAKQALLILTSAQIKTIKAKANEGANE